MIRKIAYFLLAALVIIQFFRISRNESVEISANDISKSYGVPAEVETVLKKACKDCHSNHTIYPWYSNIQPVAWWLQNHVNEGKKELNFAEFASYSAKKQHHKLKEVVEQVKEGEMPLDSYTWIHSEARLSDNEKQTLIHWADSLRQEIALKNNLPEEKEPPPGEKRD